MLLAIAACLALAPAGATSNHEYAKGEYAVIRDGLAPNKQLSLASHGDGELGDDHFHVWLMSEPAHRKLVALDDISDDNNLDPRRTPIMPSGRRTRGVSASPSAPVATK